jgi:hypothetical protein
VRIYDHAMMVPKVMTTIQSRKIRLQGAATFD